MNLINILVYIWLFPCSNLKIFQCVLRKGKHPILCTTLSLIFTSLHCSAKLVQCKTMHCWKMLSDSNRQPIIINALFEQSRKCM